jgi:RNA polymerase sigma-70 factor (ECF subfamily)
MRATPPAHAELDDLTLERARRGDRTAFRRLIDRFQRPVFSLLARILNPAGHDALVEDLAQETFVRVFRGLPAFGADGRRNLAAWILTIATRLAIDELRRPRRTEPLDHAERIAAAAFADDPSERRALGAAIARAVEQLSPEQRAAFLLREVHGLDYDAIAEALGIDVGTVKSRLHRARATLRAALSRIHDEG